MMIDRGARPLLLVLFLIAAVAPSPAPAQPIAAVADSLGHALVDEHPGGAVIGVTVDGGQAIRRFGAADSSGTRPDAQTIFEIGSTTKTFTGLLLADAIERGAVHAADPVAQYLPDSLAVPDHARGPITLAHLATHRSGLPRLPSNLLPLANPTDPYADYTVAELYAFLDGYRLARPPDTAYVYSNLGMGLLGHALARRADTSFAALVQRRITEPLDLADTRITLTSEQQTRFAQGHNRAGAPTPPWHLPTLAGAGALRATAADLLTYVHAYLTAPDSTALGQAMQRAITPHAPTDRSGTQVGFGWHITARDGHTIIWHNGGTGGFSSFAGFNPAANSGVVILANASIASEITKAGIALLEAMLDAESAHALPSTKP